MTTIPNSNQYYMPSLTSGSTDVNELNNAISNAGQELQDAKEALTNIMNSGTATEADIQIAMNDYEDARRIFDLIASAANKVLSHIDKLIQQWARL